MNDSTKGNSTKSNSTKSNSTTGKVAKTRLAAEPEVGATSGDLPEDAAMGLEPEEGLGDEALMAGLPDAGRPVGLVPEEEIGAPDDDEPGLTATSERDGDGESEPAEDTAAEGESGESEARSSSSDEPQSFLAMYFRDMAELSVLRPEEEFETARRIEDLELDLWRTMLSHLPSGVWLLDAVERAIVDAEKPDFKPYRALVARRKVGSPGPAGDRLIAEMAAQLKEIDIDRLFIDAGLLEVRRLAAAGRSSDHRQREGLPPFVRTKGFEELSRVLAAKTLRVKAAKNEFVKANLRLVVSIARRFNHGRLPLPDLIQEGNIGLMKAVERYDYRRGFRFSTYASWWIRHAISRALADKGRAVRLPVHMIDAYHKIAKSERELQSKLERPATVEEIATATGIEADKLEKMKTFLNETPVSLDRPISDDDGRRLVDVLVDPNEGPSPPEQMMSSETQDEMLKLLGGLKPIEADILRKRFGLTSDRERTLKEIGDEYRLSRERVRQLQEQALGKMRRAMAKLETL